MSLYLCELREIKPAPTITLPDGRLKLIPSPDIEHTLVKKGIYLKYHKVPELDTPYFFEERNVYRLADSVTDFFYWSDQVEWCLGFNAVFNNNRKPFEKLRGEGLISTIFANDCEALADDFREWDALIEHESRHTPEIYRMFQTFRSALGLAKRNGALWYFEWDDEHIDEYYEAKKWYNGHYF